MDLQELADRQEIVDVITRYTRAIDTRSWDDLDTVFTDDAILDYSSVGGRSTGWPSRSPGSPRGSAGSCATST